MLAAVCLARLDAVFAAVSLGLVLLYRDKIARRDRVLRLARLAAPAVVTLAVYMALNLIWFDSLLPVSGLAKGLGRPFFNTAAAYGVLNAGNIVGHRLWFGAVVLGVAVLAAVMTRGKRWARRMNALVLALVLGQVALTAYLVVATSYVLWPWYHYLLAVIAGTATLVMARDAVDRWGELGRGPGLRTR